MIYYVIEKEKRAEKKGVSGNKMEDKKIIYESKSRRLSVTGFQKEKCYRPLEPLIVRW